MWATGFINCLIYFTILARFFVQFYGLFHDSTIGSTQFPKYLSILPLIFSSCPTYFMSVPVLSFNFQAISVKMYQRDTYIHTLHYITVHYITLHYTTLHYITYIHTSMYVCMHACMHICIYSMYRNKYMYIHTWFYHVHLCMLYYMYIRIYIYVYVCVKKGQKSMCSFLTIFYPKNI